VRGKKVSTSVKTSVQDKSFAVIELEDRLRRALGTKVNLQVQASGEGEIRISFFSKDELQRILEIVER
jgi:ParB family chromosome partitioning protein